MQSKAASASRLVRWYDFESSIVRRSIKIGDQITSIGLEAAFWTAVREIADHEGLRVSQLVERITQTSETRSRSSAIRLYVLDYYRRAAERNKAMAKIASPGSAQDPPKDTPKDPSVGA